MKYYKIVDGMFQGFYSEDIHGEVVKEKEYHEISEERWEELLNGEGDIRYINGELVNVILSREELINEGEITLESEKEKARSQREKEFDALDTLDAKVIVNRETLTDEEREGIEKWYEAWKELPNNYFNINIPIEESYPERPSKVDYYYKGE